MATIQFDILDYMSGLTGFVFDRAVLTRIALDRGVSNITDVNDLTKRDKDLLLADLLLAAWLSPTTWASFNQSHGSFTKGIGGQTMLNKDDIYDFLFGIYSKYEDENLELLNDKATVFFRDI